MTGFRKAVGATLLLCASAGAIAECEEVGYIATFDVKSGSEQAFEQAIVKVAAKVLEVEKGTLLYAPYHATGGRYYMMERYENQAARDQHAKSPDVLALFPAVMSTLAKPIAVEAISAVCGS